MGILGEIFEISEDTSGELLEIFGEILEDFWILFGALIRAVRAIRVVRAVRAVRVVRAIRAVRVVRAVCAQTLYKESEDQDFSHSYLDCHGRSITESG